MTDYKKQINKLKVDIKKLNEKADRIFNKGANTGEEKYKNKYLEVRTEIKKLTKERNDLMKKQRESNKFKKEVKNLFEHFEDLVNDFEIDAELIGKIKVSLNKLFNRKIKSITLKVAGFDILEYIEMLVNVIDLIYGNGSSVVLTLSNGNIYVLNDAFRSRLRDIINEDLKHEDIIGRFSDIEVIYSFENIEWIKINNVEDRKETKAKLGREVFDKQQGAFFKYDNKTTFDLSRYGIFNDETRNYDDTCLIYALKMAGLEQDKLDIIKFYVKNRVIPVSDLNKICDRLKIQIILKYISGHKDVKKYGIEYDQIYNIGLMDNHYFIIENTEITRYSLEHYDEIINYYELKNKEVKDINYIYKWHAQNGYYKDKTRCINSYEVVKILIENKDKLLKEITTENRTLATTQFYNNINQEIVNLNYNDECLKLVVEDTENDEEKADKKIIYQNMFFDFETYVDENNEHVPYLVVLYNEELGICKEFLGKDCGKKMLKSLTKDTRLIAHNAKYDYRFLVNELYLNKEICSGGRFISSKSIIYNSANVKINLIIKCSYNIISKPLSKFTKMFKLGNVIKEIMPYNLYNEENINKRFLNIDYVLKDFINKEDHVQFLENIERWNLKKDDNYDIIKYSIEYCKIDCQLLNKGYNIFKQWMMDEVNIDINEVATSATLSHKHMINKGCYDDVYMLSGIPQQFIQGCVVGGRTMCNNNEKIYIKQNINDFDAKSLYPSAMNRMQGFLKGKPKIIENLSYDWLKTKDGYFIDIIVNSVGIKRDFPLMSLKNDEGIRIFSNDMVGKTLRVDKITLEDLIEFQKITFTVVRGYYFDEGVNIKVKNTIKEMYDRRNALKKNKNAVEEVYKLILNSAYGKSIMKHIETITHIFDSEEKYNIHLLKNYNWITSMTNYGNKWKITQLKTVDTHYNICHVGVEILSMSKRIMNEVMCLAEDNNIKIYYQDTDSMHIPDDKIETLGNLFNKKYNRVLIGEAMGQFHDEFAIDGCNKVIASECIFLGKKSYCDKLVGIDDKGTEHVDYHVRMKGIPEKVISYHVEKLGFENVFDMYKSLYMGESITFDLTNDGNKANFKFEKNMRVQTLNKFNRTIKF